MSAFGKYGTGGKVPGNYKGGSDEDKADFGAAATGTGDNQPNQVKESNGPGSHN